MSEYQIRELSQEEIELRDRNSEAFELHNTVYFDRKPELKSFKKAISLDEENEPDGYICVRNRHEPVLEALTKYELLNYLAENCPRTGEAGVGPRHVAQMRYRMEKSDQTENGLLTIFTLIFKDKHERHNRERIIILNKDENGDIIESYVTSVGDVYTRYASTVLCDLYNRAHN